MIRLIPKRVGRERARRTGDDLPWFQRRHGSPHKLKRLWNQGSEDPSTSTIHETWKILLIQMKPDTADILGKV